MNKLIVFSFIFISTIFTCRPMNLKTYSSEYYTFSYPKPYKVKEPTESSKVLAVKGKRGRVEIFKMDDFGGERITGLSSTGYEEYEYKFTPKEQYLIEDYTIWIFYLANDNETKEELKNIYTSFKLKK